MFLPPKQFRATPVWDISLLPEHDSAPSCFAQTASSDQHARHRVSSPWGTLQRIPLYATFPPGCWNKKKFFRTLISIYLWMPMGSIAVASSFRVRHRQSLSSVSCKTVHYAFWCALHYRDSFDDMDAAGHVPPSETFGMLACGRRGLLRAAMRNESELLNEVSHRRHNTGQIPEI